MNIRRMPHLILLLVLLGLSGCGRSPVKQAASGIEALNQGQPEKAVRRLEKALQEVPENLDRDTLSRIHEALGLAYARSGELENASESFKQAATLTPKRFSPLYNMGMLELERGETAQATGWLEQAVSASGQETEAHETLANLALEQDQLETAIDWLQRARTRQESSRILTAMAVARQHQLPVSELRTLLQTAVSKDPSYAPAQLNLAALLDNHRLDPEQAISHYEAYLRLEPDSVETARIRQRIQIMATRSETGEFAQPDPVRQEVEELLRQAKQAAQNNQPSQVLRLCLQANATAARHQRTDLRERALRAAATLAPESPRGHYGLGRFLLSQNRKQEALTSLRRAHLQAPAWLPSLEALVPVAVDLRQRSMASEALALTEQEAADNPDVILRVAELYAEPLGETGEARKVRRRWLEANADHPRAEEIRALL